MVFNIQNFAVISISSIIFTVVYRKVSPLLSAKLFRRYSKFGKQEKTEWNERLLSSFHAVIASVASTVVLIANKEMQNDPVWKHSLTAKSVLGFTWGYMFVDMAIMLSYFRTSDLAFFLHHFAAIFAYYVSMEYEFLVWFACVRLTAEWSTTFVNIRWHMGVLGIKDGKFYMLNGLLLALSFFLCRIVPMPYFWYQTYLYYDDIPTLGLFVMVSSCIVLDALNLFWMHKLAAGLVKLFGKTQFVCQIRHTLSRVVDDLNTFFIL